MTNIEKMFDDISSEYDRLNNLISLGLHKKIKRIVLFEIKENKKIRILDLCSGTGDISGFIKEKFQDSEVVGFDLSSKMVEVSKKRYPEIEFIKGDAANLPFSDNEFDYIISAIGFRNIEDKKSAIYEIKRVKKK